MGIKQGTRKMKAEETKKKIFESAVAMFKERGFENISVDSIVETAGVSKGTFYVHYKSRHALIADYVNTLDLDYEHYFSTLVPGIEPSKMLLLVTGKIIDTLVDVIGYELIKIIYEAHITRTIDTDSLLGYNRKLYQIYRQIVSLGVKQGVFRQDIDMETVANHFVMSIRGITYEWCIRYPTVDLKEEVLKHCDLLLQGISKMTKGVS